MLADTNFAQMILNFFDKLEYHMTINVKPYNTYV
jgi:hypothetical protein